MSDDATANVQPAATRVRDPITGRSVWLAGMVQNVRMRGDDLQLDLVWQAGHSPDDRKAIRAALEQNLRGLGFAGRLMALDSGSTPAHAQPHAHAHPPKDRVPGMTGAGVAPHGGPIAKKPVEGVKKVIAVASGKGGVGKSTVAANLAVALTRLGHPTGLMDADVYGPSVPILMGTTGRPMADAERKRIIPLVAYGVQCLSMGMLVEATEAMIWRGPMVMGAVRQLLQDADWSGLDVLVIDLPPGTGDAQLTLIQAVDLDGALLVTTPQEVALADVVRGITMFRKLDVPLLGVVENMAWYELPDGTRDFVFGTGGPDRVAAEYGTEVVARFPLRSAIRQGSDEGRPPALGTDDTAKAFEALANLVATRLGLR